MSVASLSRAFVETPIMLDHHLFCLYAAKNLSNRAKPKVPYPHTIEIADAQSDHALTFTVASDKISWVWDKAIEDGGRQIMGRFLRARLINVGGFADNFELRK
jgi:hypothetical protein